MKQSQMQQYAHRNSRSARIQLLCLWSLPLAMLMIFGGVALAGMLPPPSPDSSATEIQRFFLENTNSIRVGIIIAMFGTSLSGLFVAVITTQMRRIEGQESPLAYTQLLAGLISNMLGVIPFAFLLVAAFRADRSAELVLLLYDASWLMNLGVISPTILQIVLVGVCAFMDDEEVIFPRWYAWFSIWASFLLLADVLVYFFKTGPFAFNGAICFWFELALYSLWLIVTMVLLRRAILKNLIQRESNDEDKLVYPTVEATL